MEELTETDLVVVKSELKSELLASEDTVLPRANREDGLTSNQIIDFKPYVAPKVRKAPAQEC